MQPPISRNLVSMRFITKLKEVTTDKQWDRAVRSTFLDVTSHISKYKTTSKSIMMSTSTMSLFYLACKTDKSEFLISIPDVHQAYNGTERER